MDVVKYHVSPAPQKYLVLGFAIIIIIGAFLLSLPISSKSGIGLKFIDALFTAASATCVTGLVVVDTGTQFTLFGQIVMLVMVQLGGLGFMTMTTWFAVMLRKRVTLRDRLILKESMNQSSLEGLVRLVRKVILYSMGIEFAAAVFFAIRWSYEMPAGKAIYYGIFHAVSIFNNAGFDLFGGLTPYVDDYMINAVSIVLIILGGIGFIVMSDIIEYPKTRRLSLHSKVVLYASGVLVALGAVVIFIFEFTNMRTMGMLDLEHKILASFFQSTSLRSSGTSTVDISQLRQATQFFMIILMFIGAAPGSTGGGIKITTFVILLGAVITMIRGREDVVLFRNRLAKEQTYKAVTVTMIGLFLLVASVLVLCMIESKPFLAIMFEAASAFGTVGMSMGITADLTAAGKILIILMMFAGRLGPVTLAYAIQMKPEKQLYRYPEGKIIIG